jgi:hypothetical protein
MSTPTGPSGDGLSHTPTASNPNTAGSVELSKIRWASIPEYTLLLVQCCTENAKIRDGLFHDAAANGNSNPSGKPKEHWYRELAKVVFADLPGVDWGNKDHVEKLQMSIGNRLQR